MGRRWTGLGACFTGGGARTVDGEVDEKVHAVLDGGVEGSIRAQRLEEIHEVVRQGHMQLPPQRAQDTQLQVLELVRACIAVVNLFEFREWRQLAVEKLGSDEQASRRDHLNVWPLAAFADVRRQLRPETTRGGKKKISDSSVALPRVPCIGGERMRRAEGCRKGGAKGRGAAAPQRRARQDAASDEENCERRLRRTGSEMRAAVRAPASHADSLESKRAPS